MLVNKFIILELQSPHETLRSPWNHRGFHPFPIKSIFPSSIRTMMFKRILMNNHIHTRLLCYFPGTVMSCNSFTCQYALNQKGLDTVPIIAQHNLLWTKHTLQPQKTSNYGSSRVEDNSNSSRVSSLPWRLGLAQWAAATGNIFSCTPVACHSQEAIDLVYPKAFYECRLQTCYIPQHRHAAPLGHTLDILAWMDSWQGGWN